ncbi:pectate lyase-like protein [Morchella conica CCBAS932]|uniref:Pectate lyase-like protein n=1 Tax=Morchella conica CCBAS932 TaxID=1392247 RepID=A0A3N4KNX5_9PEZI|nr:pectate lyase-like protein [Morchella conica CCBAS932]
MKFPTTLIALAALIPTALSLVAFPGAEGFGALSTGGRGGPVYVVTNLNDSGTGSLRDAISVSNRTIVFAVGGVININSRLVFLSRQTIAGQTAPGGGITVYGDGVSFSNADHVIVRYIRFRMGSGGTSGKDAVGIAEGHDMIFDHVSVSWGRDENFSISGNEAINITIQNSMIAMGLQTHSCGGLIQTDGGVSIIRTLYVDNHTRNPKVKGVNEFINNVVYNWGGGGGYILGDSDGASYANIINNLFISGPSTTIAPFTRGNLNFHVYAANNYQDLNADGVLNPTLIPESEYTTVDFVTSRYNYPTVATVLTPTTDLFNAIVAGAGASKVRDSVDERYITELKSLGTLGQILTNENTSPFSGAGTVAAGTAPVDTDGDGMPDAWESANGLNPAVNDAAGYKFGNGYTNIENYINSLV